MKTIDVVVVGGGPAGLATGLNLIRSDPSWADRMLVLEKKTHPRPKLCGGGLTTFALQQLRHLELVLEIPHVFVRQASLEYGGHQVKVAGEPAIAITRRPEFDFWLAEQARNRGVQLLEQSKVTALRRVGGGIEVVTQHETYHARVIVGADGSKGVVRRWLGFREPRSRVARLLEVLTPATGSELEYTAGLARFDFGPARDNVQGYYWDFPSLVHGRPFMNRGIYDGRVAPDRPKADLPEELSCEVRSRLVDPDSLRLQGHPIHWFSPTNRFSTDRVLLVGDAAGAEPLFGEGIGIALGYGRVAAAALNDAFEQGRWAFKDYRRRLLTSPLGGYLMRRWLAASVIYRMSGHDLAMRALWLMGRVMNLMQPPFPNMTDVLGDPTTVGSSGD